MLVAITGVLGSVIVTPLMNAMGLSDYAARAYVVDPVAGTFAGIAMGLNAILSSLLVPVFVSLVF